MGGTTGSTGGVESSISLGLYFIIGIIILIIIGIVLYFMGLDMWLRARMSKVKIDLPQLVIMRYKRVPPETIINVMIMAKEAGLDLAHEELVRLFLATGDTEKAKLDITKVVNTLIKANNAGLHIDLHDAVKHHLAKVEIEKVVDELIIAHNSHVRIQLGELVEHYLAGLDIHKVTHAMIVIKEAEIDVPMKKIVEHFHAGGDIIAVAKALVAAKNADMELDGNSKLNLTFPTAANIDLAGVDVQQAVQDAILFRVVETADIAAITIDGVQLSMRCRVTIRPNIRMIVKGAGEETVLARINEALVSAIGSTTSHHKILENPYELADRVEKNEDLFKDTAYQVLSIDISNLEVKRDVQSELKAVRAKADFAAAKAHHLQVEAEVQKAMADAFRDGNISIQDYQEIKNTEADTTMREALAKSANNEEEEEDTDEIENYPSNQPPKNKDL